MYVGMHVFAISSVLAFMILYLFFSKTVEDFAVSFFSQRAASVLLAVYNRS